MTGSWSITASALAQGLSASAAKIRRTVEADITGAIPRGHDLVGQFRAAPPRLRQPGLGGQLAGQCLDLGDLDRGHASTGRPDGGRSRCWSGRGRRPARSGPGSPAGRRWCGGSQLVQLRLLNGGQGDLASTENGHSRAFQARSSIKLRSCPAQPRRRHRRRVAGNVVGSYIPWAVGRYGGQPALRQLASIVNGFRVPRHVIGATGLMEPDGSWCSRSRRKSRARTRAISTAGLR
jgi:hypothetical protein